ncbi:MAG: PIN domain-containing protein [bacterium]|nr:PIN domain-containing protein [bacterium]
MKVVFVDAVFWIALLNPFDDLHERALELAETTQKANLFTTQEVLIEVLNYFSKKGSALRHQAVTFIYDLFGQSNIHIEKQTSSTFHKGLTLYASRLDKRYSATDCISMDHAKELNIKDILTNDAHFTQEGFNILLK